MKGVSGYMEKSSCHLDIGLCIAKNMTLDLVLACLTNKNRKEVKTSGQDLTICTQLLMCVHSVPNYPPSSLRGSVPATTTLPGVHTLAAIGSATDKWYRE